jgi:hypothetical protein
METLYKLKKHVLFLDEEKTGISFIKDTECNFIIFESDKTSGITVEFDWKIYRMRDFKIEKSKYEENGEGIILNYISNDRKIIIKEEYFYTGNLILARKISVKPRYNGVIKEITVTTPQVKAEEKNSIEIITPFLPRVASRVKNDIDMTDTPEESSGVFVVNAIEKRESCAVWFYSEYRFESGYNNKEIIYKVKEKKELNAKDEIVAGIEFFSFYKGNYLENIENIEKFFRDKENLPVLCKKIEKGEINSFFGKMIHYYFKGKIGSYEIIKWLEIERAVLGKKRVLRVYGYLKSKEKLYTEKQKEIITMLASMIGNINSEEKNFKYIEELREKDEIIKSGINVFGKIEMSSEVENLAFIKKYRGSFYIVFFNLSPFKRELSAKIDKSFSEENIKGNKYTMFNILTKKNEGIVTGKEDIELKFEGYEYKIIKLQTIIEEELDGNKCEIYEEDMVIYGKNSFYEAVFLAEKSGIYKLKPTQTEKAVISGIKLNIDSEKFQMKRGKNRIVFQNAKVNMIYLISSKNYIEFKIEGDFESGEIIFDMNRAKYFTVDGEYIKSEVVEKKIFKEICYIDKYMVKFELIKNNSLSGITATKDSIKLNFTKNAEKKSIAHIKISLV